MKILLSPAKSLDFSTAMPTAQHTQPRFKKEIATINEVMKKMSAAQLANLMSISDKLANLNYARFADFSKKFTEKNSRPALFAFAGDVYTGLDAYSLNDDQINNAQEQIRILSGLYGVLRPLDLIQAYRLEMGTKVEINDSKNLYEFWKSQVTESLNKELKKNELLVNLASNEYFKVVDKKNLKGELIEPVFKDYKNGKLKTISFFAKKARGSMARYLIEQKNPDKDTILNFSTDGYSFSEEYSKDAAHPTFIR